MTYDVGACQGRRIRRIVGRAVVDDDDLTRKLSRLQDDRADRCSFIVRGNCGKDSRFY